MEDILYLVHSSQFAYNSEWTELKPSSIDKREDQFPGVYFSLITKDNIRKETLYGIKNILIFSKKLLEQENYHINIRDYNGFINEKNTYFSWNLNKAVKKIKRLVKKNIENIGNEVVFHDPVPMKYLCMVITYLSIDNNITFKYDIKNKSSIMLPNYEIYNYEEADKSKKPFLCYAYEKNYTGIEPLKISSYKFYKKMAKLCNIDDKQSKEKIIEEINKKSKYFYKNRDKQNIKEFKTI